MARRGFGGQNDGQYHRNHRSDRAGAGGLYPADPGAAAQPRRAGAGAVHCREPEGHRHGAGRRVPARLVFDGAGEDHRPGQRPAGPLRRCPGLYGQPGLPGGPDGLYADPGRPVCHAPPGPAATFPAASRGQAPGRPGEHRGFDESRCDLPFRRRAGDRCCLTDS